MIPEIIFLELLFVRKTMKCTLYHEKADFVLRVQIHLLDLFGKRSRQEKTTTFCSTQ